jgi:hypothetical protein
VVFQLRNIQSNLDLHSGFFSL